MAIPTRQSNPQNIISGERTFFATSSISGKRSLLQSDRSASLFITVLYHYRRQKNFRLHEFVVMPDHFHILLTLGSDLAIERVLQLIKGGFAFRAGRELGFAAPVWQKGFSEIRVRDSEAFRRIQRYIRTNPVVRHLICESSQFPYSSAYPSFILDPAPQGLKPVNVGLDDGIAEAMP